MSRLQQRSQTRKAVTGEPCKRCGDPIPAGKKSHAVFCSDKCRKRYWEQVVEPRAHCVDCGTRLGVKSQYRRYERCVPCSRVHRAERYRTIERLWAEGRTIAEIAARLDTTKDVLGPTMTRMREQGYDLPYRRSTFPSGKPRFPDQVAA